MAIWTIPSYSSGRGAEITFTYTTAYNVLTNKTTIEITNYTVVFNTGGVSAYSAVTGTLTFTAADNSASSGSLEVSASKSGNSPTVSTDVTKTIEISHGIGTSKDIVLAFSGTVNANSYYSYPDVSASITIAIATQRTLSISAGAGTTVTVNRKSSPWADTGNITNKTAVYDGDILEIIFGVSAGYELVTHTVNGSDFSSGGVHTVDSDVAIAATAKRLGLIYIFVTSYTGYELYIHNGTSWVQLAPYIHNGTSWVQLS